FILLFFTFPTQSPNSMLPTRSSAMTRDHGDLSLPPLSYRTSNGVNFFSPALNSAITSLQHMANTLSRNYEPLPRQHRRKSMVLKSVSRKCRTLSAIFLAGLMSAVPASSQNERAEAAEHKDTATPIKHVIIIIGENRTFDNIFATYRAKHGKVENLLSKGIINADGSPGPNAGLARQFQIQNINP